MYFKRFAFTTSARDWYHCACELRLLHVHQRNAHAVGQELTLRDELDDDSCIAPLGRQQRLELLRK